MPCYDPYTDKGSLRRVADGLAENEAWHQNYEQGLRARLNDATRLLCAASSYLTGQCDVDLADVATDLPEWFSIHEADDREC